MHLAPSTNLQACGNRQWAVCPCSIAPEPAPLSDREMNSNGTLFDECRRIGVHLSGVNPNAELNDRQTALIVELIEASDSLPGSRGRHRF